MIPLLIGLCRIVGGAFALVMLARVALELHRTGRLSLSNGMRIASFESVVMVLTLLAILIGCWAR